MRNKLWEAEKYALSKITIAFLPRRIPVKDAVGGEIGYTNPKEGIFIAKEHDLFSMLSADEKSFFRKGVFAHELLHQIFTDFKTHEKILHTLPPAERQIFALFANVLEDPAIEYWAKTKFGGSLLKSLKFSIAHIYEQSERIETASDPFSQYVSALIHFGDMGLIKGSFTFPDAQDVFKETAALFNSGILEANSAKRLSIALQIMDMSRPLWEEMAKERESLEKLVSEIMKDAGKKAMSGEGEGESGDTDALPEDGSKEKRRASTLSKLSSEKAESGIGKGSDGDDCEEDGEAVSAHEEKCEIEQSDDSTKSESGTPESEDDFISEDKNLSKEDKAEMKAELKKAEEEMKEKEREDARDKVEIANESLKLGSKTIDAALISNQRAEGKSSYAGQHANIVANMSTGIANTTRQLRRMLTIAQEETEYATRGKININRLNCGKNTARVFDRKRVPNNIADLIVGVAVDLSGSMGGARENAARKCCIALAEICNNLNIPLYVMGFTGDVEAYKIYHEHFVTWKNSKKDRESLVGVRAMCENYDGASIRYFTNIMKKKPAKHKLMIVISDGAPLGRGYCGDAANKDTAMAIRDAQKACDVLGVAIGNSDTKLLHSFYGNDFLHVSAPNDLFAQLSVKLKKFVKKWIDEE